MKYTAKELQDIIDKLVVLFKSGEVELQEAAELSQEAEKLAREIYRPKKL